ncbi:hypothetical protein DNTS_017702 [Danionella cerebrum]|uniref:AIG1-type G domain-containing protein n=1 Tax=Danionella cerebrum TaxID=2873325 RepID=A0A553RQD6_9TELE|nr:hypothetical protein DNTS_017702 [Danionella translucida]
MSTMSTWCRIPEQEITGNAFFILETGRVEKAKKQFIDHLLQQRPNLKEVFSVSDCDVIVVFCPISSRAGSDIDAALEKLNKLSETKSAIFVVLHHTFDPERTVPDSSRIINRLNTLTVDCLFQEDIGLLNCSLNDESQPKVVQQFKCVE